MRFERIHIIQSLIKAGRMASRKALIWANSGNISHRLDSDSMVISGSGARLGELEENDFAVVHLDSDKPEGEGKPSMEFRMHSAIYNINKNVNTVFHSQAFFTTLISCTNLQVDIMLLPESMAYIGKIGRVPYNHPGSLELADAVEQVAGDCDCIILSNHGAICAAESLKKVLLKTETLEMLCRLITISNIENIKLNYLPQNVGDDFLKHLEEIKWIR